MSEEGEASGEAAGHHEAGRLSMRLLLQHNLVGRGDVHFSQFTGVLSGEVFSSCAA